jgi:two-component system chemotaxis response regulator CheB
MKPVRVLIVDDSAVVREHLRRIISADPRLEVAGIASTGEEAVEMVERVAPDVISMDIHLPGIQGFEATRRIMTLRPTPIVVVSGIDMAEVNLSMEALRSGALAVVEKPVAATHDAFNALASRLCTQLALMSEVKVVRQRDLTPRKTLLSPSGGLATAAGNGYALVGIGASTGGPNAVMQVLNGLGRDFPLPVAVVQHMTPGFVGGFSEWLATVTPFPVSVVRARTKLEGGRVYVAPSGCHLALDGLTARIEDTPPVGNHRPSASVLFSSMARTSGHSAIGVILTGMGEDGASGLRELKAAGGFTIAEAESTAIVYGMPAAAVRMGAVSETLPLGEIGQRILALPLSANKER